MLHFLAFVVTLHFLAMKLYNTKPTGTNIVRHQKWLCWVQCQSFDKKAENGRFEFLVWWSTV